MIRNEKMPTMEHLAEMLGLHLSTVSLALSGKGTISAATRQRVLTAARDMDYRPNPLAQRLAGSVSNNLVCILSSPLEVGLSAKKLVRIQNQLVARSLEVPLYTYSGPTGDKGESHKESYAAQIRQICQQRPRAIICAGSVIHPSVFPELEAYQRDGGIVVSYDIPAPLQCDQVIFDREDNAYQAARCLLEHGHRKIGIDMSEPPSWSSEAKHLPWTSRLKGFKRALNEFNVSLRREWLFFHDVAYEAYDAEIEVQGEDMARRFLQMPERPTGLCIVNDYVAMAFMVQVMRAGVSVPGEVSIVSHDNERITSLCPVPMTSASHPVEKIAHTVVEMLMERMDGFEGPPRTKIIRGELVRRESVAVQPVKGLFVDQSTSLG